MKSVTGTFPLGNQQIYLADLWTFTFGGGSVIRWTSWDGTLVAFGNTFVVGPNIRRGKTRSVVGLEVDTLELDIDCASGTILLGTLPLQQAALNKMFDGCTVKLERAYMVTPGTVQCTVALFEGDVSTVNPSATSIHLNVKSILARLDYPWPWTVWSPTCQRKLYSPGCGVIETAYQVVVTAFGGTRLAFNASHGKPAGYFDLGKATFTSAGTLQGLAMGIKSSTTSSITLSGVLPVAASGTVILVPGCDKMATTCNNKYGKLQNFKGVPYVPRPETAR